MSHHDDVFMRIFIAILIGLAVFTVSIILIARAISPDYAASANANSQNKVIERIKPVGQVDVAGIATAQPATASKPAANAGNTVYNQACFACHGTGVAGAPKLGDKAAWAPRIAQGKAVLEEHAIKGFTGSKGVMPAKGGQAALSDKDVKAAVTYMVAQGK